MLFIGNDHTLRDFSQGGEPSLGPGSGPTVIRPRHCGDGMQLTIHRAAAGNSPSPGLEDCASDLRLVWHCRCGFRLDPQPDPREEVWAAAALVETCQWEMDHALAQLHRAIRTSSAKGTPNKLLAESAQLSPHEIQMILGHVTGTKAAAG